MPERLSRLHSWVCQQLNVAEHTVQVESVAGDASFRRYFRATKENGTRYIVMDAPPEKEDCSAFIHITKVWRSLAIQVPTLYAENQEEGFLLLEDFGDVQFHSVVCSQPVDEQAKHYRVALAELHNIQKLPNECHDRPPYDRALLTRELALFTDWLMGQALGLSTSPEQQAIIDNAFDLLIDNALSQPATVVHRDYHSRNLMWLDDQTVGVIDFQDAVIGAPTYDLVSLLRDCYIRLDNALVEELALEFKAQSSINEIASMPDRTFLHHFDLMGIQRHMKAAGIFARLALRDGKHSYLNDIPLTFGYIIENCAKHSELEAFGTLLKDVVEAPMLQFVAEHAKS